MKPARARKLRDAGSLLAISLVVVAVAGLILTGVLSLLAQMTWAVGLFITLKILVGVLCGGVLGLALGLLIGRDRVILRGFLAIILIASIVFLYIRISDLLSVHTPAMSGAVAPIAESLRGIGFLLGFVAGLHHFVRARGKGDSADTSG